MPIAMRTLSMSRRSLVSNLIQIMTDLSDGEITAEEIIGMYDLGQE